jgi:hypothetical protein
MKPASPRTVKVARASLPPAPVPEVEVELVVEPVYQPEPMYAEPPPPALPPERELTDLDRRDWLMLGGGAGGVLLAVGLGYGLARLLRKKSDDTPPEETKEGS